MYVPKVGYYAHAYAMHDMLGGVKHFASLIDEREAMSYALHKSKLILEIVNIVGKMGGGVVNLLCTQYAEYPLAFYYEYDVDICKSAKGDELVRIDRN